MARKYENKGYPTPTVPDPPGRVCFRIEVPDDPIHLENFYSALWELTRWFNYRQDAAKNGKPTADVWLRIYDDLIPENCTIVPDNTGVSLEDFMSQQIRLKPDDSCIIQMWCIDHWEDWYNPKSCVVSEVTQPTDGTELEVDECREWDVTLQGGGVWLLPIPVSSGYTITVQDATGGWSDSTLQWACPSGQAYFAGLCGTPLPTQGTDPIPTLSHMRLIAKIGSTFVDAYNKVLNVPVGTTDATLIFQANDSTIPGNFGSVSFKVTVCNSSESVWSQSWDFTISDGGWTPALDSTNLQPLAVYGAGQGWNSVYQTAQNDTLTAIQNCFPSSANIIGISVVYNDTHAVASGAVLTLQGCLAPPPFDYTQTTQVGTGLNFVWSGDINTEGLVCLIYSSFNGNIGSTRITRITVTGKGFNPFA